MSSLQDIKEVLERIDRRLERQRPVPPSVEQRTKPDRTPRTPDFSKAFGNLTDSIRTVAGGGFSELKELPKAIRDVVSSFAAGIGSPTQTVKEAATETVTDKVRETVTGKPDEGPLHRIESALEGLKGLVGQGVPTPTTPDLPVITSAQMLINNASIVILNARAQQQGQQQGQEYEEIESDIGNSLKGLLKNQRPGTALVSRTPTPLATTATESAVAGAGGAAEAGEAAAVGGAGTAAATGPLAAFVGVAAAAVAVAAAFAAVTVAVKSFAESFLESQRKFAEVSGSMAQVFARFDVFNTFLNQRMGEAIAPSASNLEASLENMLNTLAPYVVGIFTLVNNVLSFLLDALSGAIKLMEEFVIGVLAGIDTIVGWFSDNPHLADRVQNILNHLRNEQGNQRSANDAVEGMRLFDRRNQRAADPVFPMPRFGLR